ncbi:hypothetical protein AB1Y20_006685 [Prymnesium parvum]|uniref:Secreted protein n=1 Tax=Prymnesium parvum TaxID=97485 RepID=A0AB34J115_PRYPA
MRALISARSIFSRLARRRSASAKESLIAAVLASASSRSAFDTAPTASSLAVRSVEIVSELASMAELSFSKVWMLLTYTGARWLSHPRVLRTPDPRHKAS